MINESNKISISGLRIKQPIGELYVAKIKAQDLLKISYSDIRSIADENYRNKYLGIQRKLDPKRERDIAKYVQSFDATFPTSIVVYIDEKYVLIKENDNDTVEIELNNITEKTAKIIDGQHRLAGLQQAIEQQERLGDLFSDPKELDKLKNFELSLTILIGMDIAEQANIFSKVNLTQTKVNKSLVYDLEEYSKIRTPYKTAHNIVVALNYSEKSPFYKKIKRLGYIEFGEEILTQQTFVETLVKLFISSDPEQDRDEIAKYGNIKDDDPKLPFRKMFRQEQDVEIAKIIFNYFSAVQKKWPEAWGNKKYLLSKNNSFRALMKYLRDIYPKISQEGIIPTIDMFLQNFEHFEIQDTDFTSNKLKQGESGMNDFYKYLCGSITYAELIKDMKNEL